MRGCGRYISLKDSHYVNTHGDPWQMKSNHAECYMELILRRQDGVEATSLYNILKKIAREH